jgi:hypothetical protein
LLAVVGCGGSLQLTLIDASAQHPSNVAVYFTVDTADGDPVPGLTAEQFKIYEDGEPVSALESKQTILNPEVSSTHYTLLLVDMSGSVSASGDVPVIVQSVHGFAERVSKVQHLAVYAFDGSPDVQEVAGWATGASAAAGIDRLSTETARDPSTNSTARSSRASLLHNQMRGRRRAHVRHLVVFTDGTDHAHRVTREQLTRARQ